MTTALVPGIWKAFPLLNPQNCECTYRMIQKLYFFPEVSFLPSFPDQEGASQNQTTAQLCNVDNRTKSLVADHKVLGGGGWAGAGVVSRIPFTNVFYSCFVNIKSYCNKYIVFQL